MKTTYQLDAEKAEERLRKLENNQIHKSNAKIAEEQAFLRGYSEAINDAIEALIRWEFGNEPCKTID